MAPVPPPDWDLDLFLLGKTGHGKSSTGNTILGREAFLTSDAAESATLKTSAEWVKRGKLTVKVVDGPGLTDTRLNRDEQLKQAINEFSEGFVHCPNGFRAMLLVLRYGTRYTEEEQVTVEMLKKMFGENLVRDHCILVFTHGEDFDLQARRNPEKTFENWCKEQKGALGDLIKECGNRVVLFYNLTEKKRDETVDTLLSFVQVIPKRYTHEIFDRLKEKREQLINEVSAVQLKENIEPKISLIISDLDHITSFDDTPEEILRDINSLKIQALNFKAELEKENKSLNVVQSLNANLNLVLDHIEEHEKIILSQQTDSLTQEEVTQRSEHIKKEYAERKAAFKSVAYQGKPALSAIAGIMGECVFDTERPTCHVM